MGATAGSAGCCSAGMGGATSPLASATSAFSSSVILTCAGGQAKIGCLVQLADAYAQTMLSAVLDGKQCLKIWIARKAGSTQKEPRGSQSPVATW